jgi:HK97 family phage major capsid protein
MEQRAMLGTGTDSPTLGYTLVPETWEYTIYQSLVSHSGVRQCGPRVITTANGDQMHFPTAPDLRNTPSNRSDFAVAEGGTPAEMEALNFNEVVLVAYSYSSVLPVSRTFLVDQMTNLESFLPQYLGQDIARLTEEDLMHGTGNNQPQGVMAAPTGVKTAEAASKAAITYKELVETKYRLDSALFYAPNRMSWSEGTPMGGQLVWLMHPETWAEVLFIEGGDRRLALIPSAREGEPDRLLGHPVVMSPLVDKLGASKKVLVFGNFQQAYIVRQVGAFELATSEHVEFKANRIVFRTFMRCDGRYIDPKALSFLTTPA